MYFHIFQELLSCGAAGPACTKDRPLTRAVPFLVCVSAGSRKDLVTDVKCYLRNLVGMYDVDRSFYNAIAVAFLNQIIMEGFDALRTVGLWCLSAASIRL